MFAQIIRIQPHLQKNWIKSFLYLCKSPFVMSYSLNNKWERRRQEVVVAQVVLFVVSIVFELNFLLFQVVLTLFSAQFHLYQSSSNRLISHLCCEARPCLHPPALLIIFLRDDYWGGLLKTGELCFLVSSAEIFQNWQSSMSFSCVNVHSRSPISSWTLWSVSISICSGWQYDESGRLPH